MINQTNPDRVQQELSKIQARIERFYKMYPTYEEYIRNELKLERLKKLRDETLEKSYAR